MNCINLPIIRLVMIFCIACSSLSGQTIAANPEIPPAGIYQQTMLLDDGRLLRFTLSIPKGYSSQQPAPLVIALHYGGKVTAFFGRGMIDKLVGPAFKKLNAIIVAPDSIAADWIQPDNETAVLQLMDKIIARYNIDESKILLTGYSMGGNGTWSIAGKNQHKFSAAIIVSALPVSNFDWQIPLYVIHSRKDEVFNVKAIKQEAEQLQSKGVDITLALINRVGHYQIKEFIRPLRKTVPWIEKIWNQ